MPGVVEKLPDQEAFSGGFGKVFVEAGGFEGEQHHDEASHEVEGQETLGAGG